MDEKGFQKIDLGKQEDSVVPTPMESRSDRKKRKLSPAKKRIFIGVGVVGLILAVFMIITGVIGFGVYKQAMKVKTQASVAFAKLKEQDIALAREELAKTQTEITALKGKLQGLSYLKFVPLASGYYNDADHLVKASTYGINAGIVTADALIPYVDVLGLKGKGTFTGGTAQDRIRTAVQTMGKVVPQIDKIETELKQAQKEVSQVNPGHYPPIDKLKHVRKLITQMKHVTLRSIVVSICYKINPGEVAFITFYVSFEL